MKKEEALEEIKGETELIKKAQKLLNSHYDIKKTEIMGGTDKPGLKGLNSFRKELEKHMVIDEMNNEQIYEIAHILVIKTIKKGLGKH